MNQWIPVILGALTLVGAGGGIWSALTVKATRQKLVADAGAVNATTAIDLSNAAKEWTEPLRARVRELEEEVTGLRRELRTLRVQSDEAELLRARIDNLRADRARVTEQLAARDQQIADLLRRLPPIPPMTP